MKTAFAPSKKWSAAEKPVLLTFDDGPSIVSTSQVLDVLEAHRITAAFFVVGSRLQDCGPREVIARALSLGHLVGNHTYSHADLATLTPSGVTDEILRTQAALEHFGEVESLFRPPYGSMSLTAAGVIRRLGYSGLVWNVDSRDWDQAMWPDRWLNRVLELVRRREQSVVLLHDIHQSTAESLDRLIEEMTGLGCTFPPLFTHNPTESDELIQQWLPTLTGWRAQTNIPLFRRS